MKTILILGGFGFIGTNLLKFIDENLQDKYDVIVFDYLEGHPHGISFSCIKKKFCGNFADTSIFDTIFKTNKIDYVIHLISTTVPVTSDNIRFDIESNLIPTIDFLNVMIHNNVSQIIYLSSGGAIYGSLKVGEYHKELDNTNPLSSYGIMKLAIEKYLLYYQNIGKINPLILRLSNPYGPYHFSSKQGAINIAVRSALTESEFLVYGSDEISKDYIYIEDLCVILFKLIEKGCFNEVINIGSGEILSLRNILESIKVHFKNFDWTKSNKNLVDVDYVALDISKLMNIIGDYSFVDFENGLNRTISWMKNNIIK